MYRTLGIDLGTTNSVVAQLRRGEPEIIHNRQNQEATPSVVGRGKRGELLVGSSARGRVATDAENIIRSVKRFIGRKFKDPQVQAVLKDLAYRVTPGQDGDVNVWFNGRAYTPIELSAIILRRLKEDAELRSGEVFHRAVITVPAYFGERQVAATQEAGRLAGFQVLRIINEPTAAALAYGMTGDLGDEGRTVLVYDLGGGTFDISILLLMPGSVSVLGIEGDNLLGGDDFDRLLTEELLREIRAEHGAGYEPDQRDRPRIDGAAEGAKIELSSQLVADLNLTGLGGGLLILETELERERFERLVAGRIERTLELTRKAVREANLTVADIDEVLLVGGSTAIPLVERELAALFGPERIRRGVNPMQCVALGAAVQSALIAELDCPSCRTDNPLAAADCAGCGNSLLGEPRTTCQGCFLPVDPQAAECPKCGTPPVPDEHPALPPVPAAAAGVRSCPRCGTAAAPGATACGLCGESLAPAAADGDTGGLRCAACGVLNAPGAESCSGCGEWMQVANPFDITPKDLGIELNDGRMAVIIPKNTNYPTAEPVHKDFFATGGGSRRLEVAVYEGDHEVAQQNELIGALTMKLPEDTTGRARITVSFGLSADRTITLEVRIKGGEAKTVTLQRTVLDPEWRAKVDDRRRAVAEFTERWEQELTPEERRAAENLLGELDDMAAGQVKGRSAEQMLADSLQRQEAQAMVRGVSAYLSAVIQSCDRLLRPDDLDELKRLRAELDAARDAGDQAAAVDAAERADAAIAALGHTVRVLTYCRVFVVQGMVSPALAQQIRAALQRVDDGLDTGNYELVNAGMTDLVECYALAGQDIDAHHGSVPSGPVRPEEAGPR
ncbi:Hsp70 family protein [Kitasatospora indigofera]|uniref:Hsp70 family protein n=1 Tax=Kitasatospora indigofera TaxID=67307 RepID=UPI0036A4A66F